MIAFSIVFIFVQKIVGRRERNLVDALSTSSAVIPMPLSEMVRVFFFINGYLYRKLTQFTLYSPTSANVLIL